VAILIKKYNNRRLYDTGESRYITLEELAAKIRSGADVRIVDAQTGDDLTQSTLVQLVLETGTATKFLPVQLLTQMIRLSDDALAEFFSRYVTSALDMYLQAKRGMQAFNSYSPLAHFPSDAFGRMWMGPFAGSYPQYPPYPAASGPVSAAPTASDEPDEPRGHEYDVAAMRRELEELKQTVRDTLGPKPAGGARKKKRA
jgi:polyhydroxyalkanoate synthesis repressor PhaR